MRSSNLMDVRKQEDEDGLAYTGVTPTTAVRG